MILSIDHFQSLYAQRIDRRNRCCIVPIYTFLIATFLRLSLFALYQSPIPTNIYSESPTFPSEVDAAVLEPPTFQSDVDAVSDPNAVSDPDWEFGPDSKSDSLLPLRSCNILRVHGPDPYAAYGTLIWLYPINFMLYSEMHNFTLWIDFKNEYNNLCYDPQMGHENVWNYYMEPIDPDQAHCDLNQSQITVLSKKEIFPEMHYNLEWSIHAWYYHFKHHRVQGIDYERYDEEWYYTQRSKGAAMVTAYFRYAEDRKESICTHQVVEDWVTWTSNLPLTSK